MSGSSGPPGSIPKARRPLVVGLLLLIGAVMIGAGLLVNFFTNSAVQWNLLFYIAGIVVLCCAAYLWVRLSN
jgi:hypothetical protein